MIDPSELKAMILLLDDTDQEVVNMVSERILAYGSEIVPVLETFWDHNINNHQQSQIENLIHKIQFDQLKTELELWASDDDPDLYKGVCLINKYQYPDFKESDINKLIERLRLDIWLEFNYNLTALEKVRIINHILFEIHKFTGNTDDYQNPDNSFISKVLETKKGNPLSLSIIYIILAHRLNVPIFGVNLPQHFIAAYVDLDLPNPLDFNFNGKLYTPEADSRILFYINPFNRGLVFPRSNIEDFLKQLNLPFERSYFEPCNAKVMVKRLLRNLHYSYAKVERKDKCDEVQILIDIFNDYDGFSDNYEE